MSGGSTDEALKLAALHQHWTYCRRANCQCEDAGTNEWDIEHGRRVAEALWPIAVQAGREMAAKDLIEDADDQQAALDDPNVHIDPDAIEMLEERVTQTRWCAEIARGGE